MTIFDTLRRWFLLHRIPFDGFTLRNQLRLGPESGHVPIKIELCPPRWRQSPLQETNNFGFAEFAGFRASWEQG